jgi:hypothetical protein
MGGGGVAGGLVGFVRWWVVQCSSEGVPSPEPTQFNPKEGPLVSFVEHLRGVNEIPLPTRIMNCKSRLAVWNVPRMKGALWKGGIGVGLTVD